MTSINTFSILNKTIARLSKNTKAKILIHDTSGILSNEQLKLDMMYKVHICSFCNSAKSTDRGLEFCYKCKILSMKKADKIKDVYIGQCYLGITEIVKPIYYNNNLLCLVYISNLLLKDNVDNVKRTLVKRCKYTNVDANLLMPKLADCQIIDINNLSDYIDTVDIIQHIILHCDIPYNTLIFKAFTTFPVEHIKRNLLIEDIEQYINANYKIEITLKDLSKLYFIHQQYLCKLFKKETGVGFVDYINNTRISNAKRLLAISSSNINSIAFEVGYNNISNFNKIFRKLMGCTPKEYRNSFGKKY